MFCCIFSKDFQVAGTTIDCIKCACFICLIVFQYAILCVSKGRFADAIFLVCWLLWCCRPTNTSIYFASEPNSLNCSTHIDLLLLLLLLLSGSFVLLVDPRLFHWLVHKSLDTTVASQAKRPIITRFPCCSTKTRPIAASQLVLLRSTKTRESNTLSIFIFIYILQQRLLCGCVLKIKDYSVHVSFVESFFFFFF